VEVAISAAAWGGEMRVVWLVNWAPEVAMG
jgi:hypothetical protein